MLYPHLSALAWPEGICCHLLLCSVIYDLALQQELMAAQSYGKPSHEFWELLTFYEVSRYLTVQSLQRGSNNMFTDKVTKFSN